MKIVLNTLNSDIQSYVLVESGEERVLAIIEAKPNEDVTDRVLLAIKEDLSADSVELTNVGGDNGTIVLVDTVEDDEEIEGREYYLILTLKY